MKTIFKTQLAITLIVVTGLLCAGSYTLSAEENKGSAPMLLGTWKSDKYTVAYPKGTNTSVMVMRIVKQDGPYFWSERQWRSLDKNGEPGHIGDKKVFQAGEITLGVIDYDNKSVYMVEKGDSGTMKGKIIGKDKMEFVYTETGEFPLVFRTVLTREKKGKK